MAQGKKTEITPEFKVAVLTAIKLGAGREAAAQSAMIHPDTLRAILARGEASHKETSGASARAGATNYMPEAELWESVVEAEGKVELRLLQQLWVANNEGDTSSTKWLLERLFKKKYAPTNKMEHTGKDGERLGNPVAEMSKEERAALAQEILKKNAGDSPATD
ncbi:hypothetical protein OAF54_01105 [bacterium]|nr:hypothetical protein [bacterium]